MLTPFSPPPYSSPPPCPLSDSSLGTFVSPCATLCCPPSLRVRLKLLYADMRVQSLSISDPPLLCFRPPSLGSGEHHSQFKLHVAWACRHGGQPWLSANPIPGTGPSLWPFALLYHLPEQPPFGVS